MAELNLNQITNKLSKEFVSDTRKLIFWYDANAEFVDDIETMEIVNAKILYLEKDNQFHIKHFLERVDTKNHYLIYAPFPKPPIVENHLADTLYYSKEFFADRASLVCIDLGIHEKYKPTIQTYIKFFAAKDRTEKFYVLEIENFNDSIIETGIMSVICKTKVLSFEEILRTIITSSDLEDNKYLAEFEKYNLVPSFWKMCEEIFGYTNSLPSLPTFVFTLFSTYSAKVISTDLPKSIQNYCSYKSGNIIAFVDGMMNSVIFSNAFEKLSDITYHTINMEVVLQKLNTDDFIELEIFRKTDVFIIKWLIARLEDEDTDAKLAGFSIPEICRMRRKMHYGNEYFSHYYVIENAHHIVKTAHFEPQLAIQEIWKEYSSKDYAIDQKYRYFYYHYDKVANNSIYETLRELVENIYTNEYLGNLSVAWSNAFIECKADTGLVKQQDFFNKYVKYSKERTVVIISDALRFEVGQTLMKRLIADEKCTATIAPMQSVLPSYTRFGMSALLPHKELSMSEDFRVLVDGKVCNDLKSREQILKSHVPNSKAVQLDDIKTVKEAKALTMGQDVVYVYHDQIDARGDTLKTENEVFTACEEAVEEIHTMITRFTSAGNTRFVITADHGFLYKRDKLTESDKISGLPQKNTFIGKRYVIADERINVAGILSFTLGDILKNEDARVISTPIGSDIFKVSGGGQNFVHGGASLQEILIPVIEVKTKKAYTQTKSVGISLVSITRKITNLTTNIDFMQSDAVSDVNKETTYKVYFISDDNEKVSNDNIYVADKKDSDASKRVFRLKFIFKNKQYDKNRKYYLVAYDEKNALEVIRHEVQMDLAFTDDFGWNI